MIFLDFPTSRVSAPHARHYNTVGQILLSGMVAVLLLLISVFSSRKVGSLKMLLIIMSVGLKVLLKSSILSSRSASYECNFFLDSKFI